MRHDSKPSVLILTSSFPRSSDDDTCGYVREFARSLCADFSVSVLTPPDRDTDDAVHDGLTVVRSWSPVPQRWERFRASADLNRVAGGTILAQILFGVSLSCYVARAVMMAWSATLICCHWMAPCGAIGLVCSYLLGCPFVIVEHSGALHLLRRSRLGIRMARKLVSRSTRIYVVSADLKQKLEAIVPGQADKIELIPMGVDTSAYSPPAALVGGRREVRTTCVPEAVPDGEASGADRLKVLFIGRLTQIKGAEVLIRAAAEVPDVGLTICGEGESRASLMELARSLGVQATFSGQVDRITKRKLLEQCDVVVVPSVLLRGQRSEGLPVVLLEAMAAAKPVIASRCGGVTDVIVDGENGLLFEPGDSGMLATRIRELESQPLLKSRIGARAAVTASRYDWSVIGERFRRSIGAAL